MAATTIADMSAPTTEMMIMTAVLESANAAAGDAFKRATCFATSNGSQLVTKLILVGAGKSYNTLQMCQKLIQTLSINIEVHCIVATRMAVDNYPRYKTSDTLFVFLSRSGKTLEVIEAASRVKTWPCETIAITEKDENPLANICDHIIPVGDLSGAVPGISQIALGIVCYGLVAGILSVCDQSSKPSSLTTLLKSMSIEIPVRKQAFSEEAKNIAHRILELNQPHLYISGSGIRYPLAVTEGNCMAKELLKMCFEPVDLAGIIHGACETFDKNTVLIVLQGNKSDRDHRWVRQLCLESRCHLFVIPMPEKTATQVPDDLWELVSPFIQGALVDCIIKEMADQMNIDMTKMRYYGQIKL